MSKKEAGLAARLFGIARKQEDPEINVIFQSKDTARALEALKLAATEIQVDDPNIDYNTLSEVFGRTERKLEEIEARQEKEEAALVQQNKSSRNRRLLILGVPATLATLYFGGPVVVESAKNIITSTSDVIASKYDSWQEWNTQRAEEERRKKLVYEGKYLLGIKGSSVSDKGWQISHPIYDPGIEYLLATNQPAVNIKAGFPFPQNGGTDVNTVDEYLMSDGSKSAKLNLITSVGPNGEKVPPYREEWLLRNSVIDGIDGTVFRLRNETVGFDRFLKFTGSTSGESGKYLYFAYMSPAPRR